MTGTLISLISVFIGIIAANIFGALKKAYTFGFTGNTLIGVFGSILLIKTLGKLGFDPWSIMKGGSLNAFLFSLNMLMSGLGGILGVFFIKQIYIKINK